ncbi:unnamed protein product [Blepharisma stoltei]|uniref:Uncharacterized protein n=1 Tax=Blepharisma stoltei TaxID=1481888 RepID=A0AAU9J5J5_9CILI|nr:unnamed protein product [Blepharisma stoltei]
MSFNVLIEDSLGNEAVILNCNKLAMEALSSGDAETASNLLTKANNLLRSASSSAVVKLKSITLNNFGCLYKRINNPLKALKYLSEALECESESSIDNVNLAGTLLNICAIKSQLDLHEEAVSHGLKAIKILNQAAEQNLNTKTTLAIAYHNVGIEQEFLDKIKEAQDFFMKGWEIAHEHLGSVHPVTQLIGTALNKNSKQSQKVGKLESLNSLANSKAKLSSSRHDTSTRNSTLNHVLKQELRREQLRNKERNSLDEIELESGHWDEENKVQPPNKSLTIEKKNKLEPMPSGAFSESAGLTNARFLTGERMQPMYKDKTQNPGNYSVRITKKKTNLKPIETIKTPNALRKKFIKPIIKPDLTSQPSSKFSNSPETSTKSIRKFDMSFDSRIINIEGQLQNLQKKLHDFEAMCQPLKELEEEPKKISKKEIEKRRRGFAARKIQREVREWLQKRENAAQNIQKHFRGYRDRKRYLKIKSERNVAAGKIQKWYRNKRIKVNKEVGKDLFDAKASLVETSCQTETMPPSQAREKRSQSSDKPKKETIEKIIQSDPINKKLVLESTSIEIKKPEVQKHKNLFQMLAMIQAYIRGFIQRKRYEKIKKKIFLIQSAVRMHQCHNIYKGIREAVIFIQSVYRGHLIRKKFIIR